VFELNQTNRCAVAHTDSPQVLRVFELNQVKSIESLHASSHRGVKTLSDSEYPQGLTMLLPSMMSTERDLLCSEYLVAGIVVRQTELYFSLGIYRSHAVMFVLQV